MKVVPVGLNQVALRPGIIKIREEIQRLGNTRRTF